jgi:hypothetical protein
VGKQGIGITQYATRQGCTRQSVYRAIAEGRCPVLPDGSIDPDAADRAWQPKRGMRIDAARRGDPATDDAYQLARTRKMQADADLAEIKAREASGELVSAAQVHREAFEAGRITRDRVLAVGSRVIALVRASPSDAEGLRILNAAQRKALNAAADEIAAMADA